MIDRLARISAAVLLVTALALVACGRKGGLTPPKGEESTYTGQGVYPAPDSVVPQAGESPAAPGTGADSDSHPKSTGSP